jgi:threonine-phosphate decarboxylase
MQMHGGNSAEIAQKYDLDEDRILDFSSNINPLGFPASVTTLLRKDTGTIACYPDTHSTNLRKVIAPRIGVTTRNIIVGNGSTELIYLLPRVFKPRSALIIQPTFTEYQASLLSSECVLSYLSLKERYNFRVEIDDIVPFLPNIDMMYVCNPNNPTGVLLKKEVLKPLIIEAGKRNVMVVVDESFMDFSGEDSLAEEAVKRDKLIVLNSMTKFYGIPGLRLGYLVAYGKTVERINKHKEPWSVNVLAQRIGSACLKDDAFCVRTRQFVSRERHYLYTQLNAIEGMKTYDSSANFLLSKIVKNGLTSTEMYTALAREGILIRDCRSFKGMGTKFIRLAVKKRKQNNRLIKALKGIMGGVKHAS